MPDIEVPFYIDSLAYDSEYYRGVGHALKNKIDSAAGGLLDSGGEFLVYGSPFESAKLNIGDYSQMANTGGQFSLSLGAKHGIYGKSGFKRRDGKYHVDVFADTHTFILGDEVVYREGTWII